MGSVTFGHEITSHSPLALLPFPSASVRPSGMAPSYVSMAEIVNDATTASHNEM